jgi:hypothetical protein
VGDGGSAEVGLGFFGCPVLFWGRLWKLFTTDFENLVRQADFADQVGEPGVGADGVELEEGV